MIREQIEITSPDFRGYAKVREAAKYSGVSERTLRDWLRDGLRHIRLPSGTILIPYAWIDEYLTNFEVSEKEVEALVERTIRELGEI